MGTHRRPRKRLVEQPASSLAFPAGRYLLVNMVGVIVDGFNIRPESVDEASKAILRGQQDFQTALEKLRTHVSGGIGSGDEVGSVFQAAYAEVTQMGLGALAHLGGQLGAVAAGLQQMSGNTTTTDAAQTQALQRIQVNLE